MVSQKETSETIQTEDLPQSPSRRKLLIGLGAGAGLVAVGGAGFMFKGDSSPFAEGTDETASTQPSVITSPTETQPPLTNGNTQETANPEIVKPGVEFDLPLDMLPTTTDPGEWISRMQELKRIAYSDNRPDLIPFMYYGEVQSGELSRYQLEIIAWTKAQKDITPDLEWVINWRSYPERTTFPLGDMVISVDVEEWAFANYDHRILDYTILPKDVVVEQDGRQTELTLYTIAKQETFCEYPSYGSEQCIVQP